MFQTKDRDELIDIMEAFHVPTFAVELDDDGEWISLGHNSLTTHFTGHEISAVQGRKLYDLFPEEDAAATISQQWECVKTRAPVRQHISLDFPTGRSYHTATMVPVIEHDGSIRRLMGNFVGLPQARERQIKMLLDELTMLSMRTSTLLFKALHAIELRASEGDISPAEARFLATFHKIAGNALSSSLEIRDLLQGKDQDLPTQQHLLSNSALLEALDKLTEHNLLTTDDPEEPTE